MGSLVGVNAFAEISCAAVGALVQPAKTIDGNPLPFVLPHMLGVCYAFQDGEEAADAHRCLRLAQLLHPH